MFDAKALFKGRLDAHIKLLNRYLRYIFNEHFMIALLFMIVALAVYYQKGLQVLPDNFPTAAIVSFVLMLVVIYNPLNFFTKEPDKVFLIAKERALKPYFKNAFLYNYFFQLYIVVLAVGVVSPLFLHVYNKQLLIILIAFTLILKAMHMWMAWLKIHYDQNVTIKRIHLFMASFLSLLIFYTVIIESNWLFVLILLKVLIFVAMQKYYQKHSILNWEALIDNDGQRLAVFYRFVSMFADVPMVSNRVKKRRLLSKIFNQLSTYDYKKTYEYLYGLTLIRSHDYLSLIFRLTILGLLVIYFIPNDMIQIGFALVFLYMTLFQLTPLYEQHRMNIWTDLYPVPLKNRQASFMKIIRVIGVSQVLVFVLYFVVTLNFINAGATLVLGFVLVLILERFYIGKKIGIIRG